VPGDDMLKSACDGCALGREELERWALHQVSGRVGLATRFRIGRRWEGRLIWLNSSGGGHLLTKGGVAGSLEL